MLDTLVQSGAGWAHWTTAYPRSLRYRVLRCLLVLNASGLLLALLGQQRLERAGVSAAREQLIAIDQIEQRHRLLAQRMDDVMVIDDVAVLAVPLWRPSLWPTRSAKVGCAVAGIAGLW